LPQLTRIESQHDTNGADGLHNVPKSENIFVTMGPDTLDRHPQLLVIADFDTARRLGLTERPTSTIGTAGFMAPEVYMAKEVRKAYSFAADSMDGHYH
jgi:serine/threonine protein kinase